VLPEHYVFPFRVDKGKTFDPNRHQTTLKTSWLQMLRYSGIKNLRMYDLRHTAITRLCEDPENSEEVIESIAGHITHQMKKRYCHIRVEARRAALARLAPARLDRALGAQQPAHGANARRSELMREQGHRAPLILTVGTPTVV
jgi:integrase